MQTRKNLIVENIDEELLLFDPERDEVVLLDSSSARVFQLLNEMSPEAIAARAFPDREKADAMDFVQSIVAGFIEKNLLEESPLWGRRDFARAASAGLLTPVLTTMLLPSPAMAASCCTSSTFLGPADPIEAPAGTANSSVLSFSLPICVPAGRTVVMDILGAGGVDDIFAVRNSVTNQVRAYTVYAMYLSGGLNPRTCDTVFPQSPVYVAGPATVTITPICSVPASGCRNQTLNFTHCNVVAGNSYMPAIRVRVV